MRKCNGCGVIGHLAVNCPNVARNAPPPPAPLRQPVATGVRTTHKTEGATCTACNKTGHVEAQCWSKHPEKLPSDYAKERGQQMTQINRKRQKAAEYTSPGYQYPGHGMALTYKRPAAVTMQRRSARAPQPSRQAREAAEGRSARSVHFSPAAPVDLGAAGNQETVGPADPQTSLVPTQPPPEVPGVPDKYAYKERLPQSFSHGLPSSNLEPGTTE